jgi:transcriptional regulator with XRE-family HTH domain
MVSPVAANLRYALAQAGLTQEALARQLDMSLSAVNGWARGERTPPWPTIVRIAAILQRDPHWFYAPRGEVKA